ncbi:hypothetical protein [Sphingobium terrigena]|uniref:hypothetical protein n=1 Tax=Sphingobium terrigena TaxID=2304063 RepID=UPI001EEFD03C|nr:hypothetical protein [Sphingobium terrigena]
MSPDAHWPGNFRDLAVSVTRMATLSPKGRIDLDCVDTEIGRLKRLWSGQTDSDAGMLATLLDPAALAQIDPFDRVQLAETVRVSRASRSLSEAGRALFSASRTLKAKANDADRLRKYLSRFDLDWAAVTGGWKNACQTTRRPFPCIQPCIRRACIWVLSPL